MLASIHGGGQSFIINYFAYNKISYNKINYLIIKFVTRWVIIRMDFIISHFYYKVYTIKKFCCKVIIRISFLTTLIFRCIQKIPSHVIRDEFALIGQGLDRAWPGLPGMRAKNDWVVSLIKDPFRARFSARTKRPCQECERKTT